MVVANLIVLVMQIHALDNPGNNGGNTITCICMLILVCMYMYVYVWVCVCMCVCVSIMYASNHHALPPLPFSDTVQLLSAGHQLCPVSLPGPLLHVRHCSHDGPVSVLSW